MTTTFIILGITIVLFVWGRWSADGVALFSLLALSGVIDTRDALAGFGNPTVLMIENRQMLYGNVGYRVLQANVEELLRQPATEASWC